MLDGTGACGAELFSDPKDEKRDGLRWSDVDFEERSIEVYGKSRDYETAPFPESVHDILERWRGLLDPPTEKWPVFPTGHYQSKRQELVESIGEETVSAALEGRGDVGKTEVLDRLHREHEVPPPSISKEGVRRLMKRLTKEAGIEPDGDYDYLTYEMPVFDAQKVAIDLLEFVSSPATLYLPPVSALIPATATRRSALDRHSRGSSNPDTIPNGLE